VKDSLHYTGTYLVKSDWQCALLDMARRKAIIEVIDTYDPLLQAVAIAFSSYENNLEVTTFLINLN